MGEPFCGAVLTGGRSRRMGWDKAVLAAAPVAALREAGADPVLTVGRDVADQGPLDGVRAALLASPVDVVVVLACDMPDVTAKGVRMLVDALGDAAASVPVVAGRPEPLHAAWRRSMALAAVQAALAAGERAVAPVLRALGAVEVTGLDPAAVRNVNTPSDLRHGGAMEEIDVAELARRHAEGGFVLDVRQPAEFEEARVPGAVLIPLDQLGARIGEVPQDRELNVICRSGGRSATAVKALNEAGYQAVNVAGGTLAWIEAGHPFDTGSAP